MTAPTTKGPVVKPITLSLSLPESDRTYIVQDAKSRLTCSDHTELEQPHAELDRQYQLAICDRIDNARKREVVAQLLAPALTEQMRELVSNDAVDKLFKDVVAGGVVVFKMSWT
jgi:hypothetical protein